MLISEIMSKKVLLVTKRTTIQQAAHLMAENRTGSVLIQENNIPVGILTERDLAYKIIPNGVPIDTAVEEVMTSPIYSCRPDADIFDVANTMTQNNIKKMPVMEGTRIYGIVTQTDVIKHLFQSVKELQRKYAAGSISQTEYAEQSAKVFAHDSEYHGNSKEWHMICQSCGNKFLNQETNKKLHINQCPQCASTNITFDKAPPI